jgi:hypothetical protein
MQYGVIKIIPPGILYEAWQKGENFARYHQLEFCSKLSKIPTCDHKGVTIKKGVSLLTNIPGTQWGDSDLLLFSVLRLTLCCLFPLLFESFSAKTGQLRGLRLPLSTLCLPTVPLRLWLPAMIKMRRMSTCHDQTTFLVGDPFAIASQVSVGRLVGRNCRELGGGWT